MKTLLIVFFGLIQIGYVGSGTITDRYGNVAYGNGTISWADPPSGYPYKTTNNYDPGQQLQLLFDTVRSFVNTVQSQPFPFSKYINRFVGKKWEYELIFYTNLGSTKDFPVEVTESPSDKTIIVLLNLKIKQFHQTPEYEPGMKASSVLNLSDSISSCHFKRRYLQWSEFLLT